jgi:hypothetical protein
MLDDHRFGVKGLALPGGGKITDQTFADDTCHNPSFGLAIKAKGLQGCGPKGSPGVTSETPGSVGECEGVSLHTPKATPKLGEGVPMDSRNFRERFEGSNLNVLLRSLYQWKALEA